MSTERDHILEEVEICLSNAAAGLINRTASNDRIVVLLESLNLFVEESPFFQEFELLCSLIREIIEILETISVRRRGRPSFEINLCSVENLLSMNFRLTFIGKFLGVSTRTLHRRLRAAEISVRATYTSISDEILDTQIAQILHEFPNTGYKRMQGFLLSRNLKITQFRFRDSMRRVDPQGVYQRTQQNRAIVRRQYFVSHSNFLWHIDTNLKLGRWKIAIRGGLDGKSRTCVYLDAGNNNRADSNFAAFGKAVQHYGIPYRCRSDKGGENRMVAEFMLQRRGLGRSSHICGKSVHNQRIERFWRDLGYGLISFYRQVFTWMENSQILDVENPLHLFCLHFTHLPRINRQLEEFMNAWNCHPLSTEGNKTPQQLMLIHLPPPNYDMIMSLEDDPFIDFSVNQYADLLRIEEQGIHNFSTDYPSLTSQIYEDRRLIDPMRDSLVYGKDIFLEVLNLVNYAI